MVVSEAVQSLATVKHTESPSVAAPQTVNLSKITFAYDRLGGHPLIGITDPRPLERVSILELEMLGLTFHRAFPHRMYRALENLLSYPELTRLNGVSQMQIGYTTAGLGQTNSRYAHVLFTAQKIYETLLEINSAAAGDNRFQAVSTRDVQAAIIAALFHDYAHGPFSHVFEYVAHTFKNGARFCHDQENQMKLTQDPELVSLMDALGVSARRIVGILDDCDERTAYLHLIVKVIGDRIAYLQADSYGDIQPVNGWRGLSEVTDTSETVKTNMRLIEDAGQMTLVFLPDGYEAVKKMFRQFRKDNFTKFCLSSETTLVAGIVGRNLKKLALESEDRSALAKELVNLSDRAFIERLASADDSDRRLMDYFFGDKKVDEHFLPVVRMPYSDPDFHDVLTQDLFRKELRRYLYKAFEIEHNDVYAVHPLGDESFYIGLKRLNPNTFECEPFEVSYEIPDADKYFTVFLGRDWYEQSGKGLLEIQLTVKEFIREYTAKHARK